MMNYLEKLISSFKKNKRRKASRLNQFWTAKRKQSQKAREEAKKCADRARALTRFKGR